MSKLKEGDKVYVLSYDGKITDVITIDRVTKTQAKTRDGKYIFRPETYGEGSLCNRRSMGLFYTETPELQKKLWRQESEKQLSKTDYSALSDEVIEKLLSILNNQ